MSKFAKLEELCLRVSNHPELAKHLVDEGGVIVDWLPMGNICNGHVEASEEFIELMNELATEINGLFITNDGQSSNEFYDVRKLGYGTKVIEADGFGPLGASFTNKDNKWRVAYG